MGRMQSSIEFSVDGFSKKAVDSAGFLHRFYIA
jgi:hypothetical protein